MIEQGFWVTGDTEYDFTVGVRHGKRALLLDSFKGLWGYGLNCGDGSAHRMSIRHMKYTNIF